jgi:peroxiredoxin
MKNFLLSSIVIISLLLLNKCKSQSNSELCKFSFNEKSYLQFHVKNCKAPSNFILIYNTIFPSDQKALNIFFDHDTTEIIQLYLNHPVTVRFINSNSYISCYTLPNDTLKIWLDLDDIRNFADRITFKGKTASISNYLTKNKRNTSLPPHEKESVEVYNNRVDGITKKELAALHSFNDSTLLPEWFVKQEQFDIQYTGAYNKITQFSQSYMWYNKYRPRNTNFIDQLNIKVDNPEAKFSESYFAFLSMICPNKYDTLLVLQNRTSEIFYKFIKENLITAKKYLHSEIKDLFVAQRICTYLTSKAVSNALKSNDSKYFQRVDTLINYAKTNLTDTAILNILLSYQKEQIRFAKGSESLKPGTKAPDFKLADINGKMKALSDYRGQIVLINFWASWCAPCIKSIPEKNKLYYENNNKGIVFLNVCIDSDSNKWRSLIKENNFQGIHLICSGNWIDQIQKSYFINAIPQYTLVNKSGEIIKNKIATIKELEDLIKMQI